MSHPPAGYAAGPVTQAYGNQASAPYPPYAAPNPPYPQSNYPVKGANAPYPNQAPSGNLPYPQDPNAPPPAGAAVPPSYSPPAQAPPTGAAEPGAESMPSAPPVDQMDVIEGYGRNSFDNGLSLI